MSRPRTAQEIVHWLEVGGGARGLRLAALLAVALMLSLRVAWTQFRGPLSESTLIQADMGRQLARGQGFTTQVNYPQTSAAMAARGRGFDARQPYPELHHAPLYAVAVAGALAVLPAGLREAWFVSAPVPPDGFMPDYVLLGLNLLLFWIAVGLSYRLARRLFDLRTAVLAAGAVLLSSPLWQATAAVNGTPLLMVLALAAFLLWHRLEEDAAGSGSLARVGLVAAGLGGVGGLLFLAEYSAGALAAVALIYTVLTFGASRRVVVTLALCAGFAAVTTPWLVRNVALTGHPVALARYNVALKFGDPTAEPATLRTSLATAAPAVDLKKLGNKVLTALQENLKSRLWSGGAMWFAAFFVAGWLYAFRTPAVNKLRWVFTATFGVLLLAQASLNSGESERLVTVWMAPLVIVFGAGFFGVLLGSNARLSAWPKLTMAVLLGVQALPLVHSLLEPRRLHFQYPPYFPSLFQGMRQELQRREAAPRFGIMADVPAGVAWYGQTRVWALPPRLRDFYAVTLQQPIGELLLTPRTLDRPFFTELNARPILPGAMSAVPNRFGEWGEIYAGLLTGALPREFPLAAPQKLAENLYVLMNPALPPVRGK
jgi:hypothetical protein